MRQSRSEPAPLPGRCPTAAELGSVDESLKQRMKEWFPGDSLPSLYKVWAAPVGLERFPVG